MGAHTLKVTATDKAGNTGPVTTFGFGHGPFTMAEPVPQADGRASVTTTDRVTLVAEGPTNGTTGDPEPIVKWRVAGTNANATTGWHDADTTDAKIENLPGTSTSRATAVVDTSSFDDGTGNPNPRRPVLLELQICVPYPAATACTWESVPTRVLRVPHAFGSNYPVADAGPGEVALWTGEFGLAKTDATEPGYNTELRIARNHGSYGGPAADLDGGPAGVFGPGWTAALDGPGTGLSDSVLLDDTPYDGTLVLTDDTGTALVWTRTTTVTRRTNATLVTGDWVPADEDTRLSDIKLTVTGAGAGTKVAITEVDGTVTTFKVTKAITGAAEYEFTPDTVQESAIGQAGKTSFGHDTDGRVTRILTGAPAVTCPTTGPLVAGCHALDLIYGTTGSADGRVNEIRAVHGTTSTLVTSYDYDSDGRLVGVTDERTDLTTTYTWAGTSGPASRRLASITPPGLKAIRFTYADSGDAEGKLVKVTRDNPTGTGTTTLAQYRYDTPTHDDGAGGVPDASARELPVTDAAGVAAWNQTVAPTYAAAVFPQGSPTVDADPAEITASEWKHAELSYSDLDGRTVNTATYGAGRWLLTATDYDAKENVTRTLGSGDIAGIQDGLIVAADAGTLNVYDEVKNPSGTVTLEAGTVLTETFGPARYATTQASTDGAGGVAWVRPHTRLFYDEDAPGSGAQAGINPATGAAYGLQTRSVTRPWDVTTQADLTGAGITVTESKSGYAALETGDKTGWELGVATSTTTVMPSGGTDIVARSRFDDQGRVIETRQPSSVGADAGTRQTVYYAAGANATDSACGDKPEWAGLACVTRYAGGDLPAERVTAYDNEFLQPLTVEETVAGTLRRTTTNTYDDAGRPAKTWTKAHGVAASTPTTGTETSYDPDTGLATVVKAVDNTGAVISGKTVTTGYDTWGRTVSYEPAAGEVTTTTYNAAGEVDTVTDPRGTTTYTYDGTDADGSTERRGLATKVTTSRPGADPVEFTGAYDPDGALVTHVLPGGITQRTAFDAAGELTESTYTGTVQMPDPADPDGPLVATADMPWVGWSQTNDALGRVSREWTPEGAAFTGALETGAANAHARAYEYDRAGRLVEVVDHTAPAGTGAIGSEDGNLTTPTGTVCETRNYGFDTNGNRTNLRRKAANPDGTCGTAVTGSRTWGWDNADRPTNTGYDIDPLGRIKTLPAGDTPTRTADIELSFYDNDTVHTVAQGAGPDTVTSTYTLDPIGRRATETTTGGTSPSSVDMHYTSDSDNPGWSRTTTGAGGSPEVKTTRYLDNLSGDLAATLTSDGTSETATGQLEISLTNPHGDNVTTVEVPDTGEAEGIGAWSSYDEYGNTATTPAQTPGADTGIGYGWVGSKQRATQPHGIILMGARVYLPGTGTFGTRDPVAGGNDTAYGYTNDPINGYDLTGECIRPLIWCSSVKDGRPGKAPKGYEYRWEKYSSHQIGRVAEDWVMYVLRLGGATDIQRGPGVRRHRWVVPHKNGTRTTRILDVSYKRAGKLYYLEVKGNGGHYNSKQRADDARLREMGLRIGLIRVKNLPKGRWVLYDKYIA